MLHALRGQFQRLMESAVALGDVLGDGWRHRFCGALCAAHFLEHQLGYESTDNGK